MTVHDEQVSHRHPDASAVRKAVRGAAIGNTVEWFDFAIYSVPGHLHRRQVLPVRQRHRRAAQHFRDLRGGVLHATARRLLLRAAGRPDRPPARAGDRDPADVGARRSRSVWCPVTTPSASAPRCFCCFCAACKASRRAASTAAARATSPSTPPTSTAASSSRSWCGRWSSGFLLGSVDRHRAAGGAFRGSDGLLRLAHPVPAGGRARRRRPLHPAAAARHPGVRGAARRRRGLRVAAEGGHHDVVAAHPADLRAGGHPQRRLLHRCSPSCRATSPRRSSSPRWTRSSRSPSPAS